MSEIFSGFLIGYGLSLLFTALASIMLLEARLRSPFLSRAIAPNVNVFMLSVPISMLSFLGWTALGMVLGLLYRGAEDSMPAGAIGSPNGAFTGGMVAGSFALLGLLYYLYQRLPPWRVTGFILLAMVLFGWAMPYMARAAKFD